MHRARKKVAALLALLLPFSSLPLCAKVVAIPAAPTGLVPALGNSAVPALGGAAAPAGPPPVVLSPSLTSTLGPTTLAPVAAVPVAATLTGKIIAPLKLAAQRFAKFTALAGGLALSAASTEFFDHQTFAGGVDAGATATSSDGTSRRTSGLSPPRRLLEAIKKLKIGSYNVENLFEHVGSHVPDPDKPGSLKKVSDAKPKPDWALREEAKIILEQDLDIVTLAEVENFQALQDFNERFLGGLYQVYLIEGNDERGIDIAFLVKKDLPFEIEQRSHKEETWVDTVLGGGPRPLFSRDLTSLVIRAPGKTEPLFVLFGTHYKSKRDRPGDPESNIMRAAQVRRTAVIMERYRAEFGADVPMMIAGDFNGEVSSDPIYHPLTQAAGLTDSFDASPNPPSDRDRVTHTYHPIGGAAHYAQMDAVLVSKALRGTVLSAEVYRYRDENGAIRPVPKTYQEREKNPSDHFPLIVTLDFAPIRTRAFPEWTPAPKPAPKPEDGFEEFAYEYLRNADPELRERVLALTRAYLAAGKPDRRAAYFLNTAYYDGIDSLQRFGVTVEPETRAQIDRMLAVLEGVRPRALARRRGELDVNVLINTFVPMLGAFGAQAAPAPAPRDTASDARYFADSTRAWLDEREAAFDVKIADWLKWTADPAAWLSAHGIPGWVSNYTMRNAPLIQAKVEALQAAKAAFAREVRAVPETGALTPQDVRRLYAAWNGVREAANAASTILGDSFDKDLTKRALISNLDQGGGRYPVGLNVLFSPVLSADWDATRSLSAALRP